MNRYCVSVLLVAVSAMLVEAQEQTYHVRVPQSDGRPVTVDGVFSSGEWEDAVPILVHNPIEIYVKSYRGDLYIGVKYPYLELPMVDLFLNPEGMATYQLHASGYLADRIIPEDELCESFLDTQLSLDWTANTVRWDSAKRDSLVGMGVYGQEMLKQAILPFEGFEFRIRRSQFSSRAWYIRLEVSVFAGSGPPITFPGEASLHEPWKWVMLDIGG